MPYLTPPEGGRVLVTDARAESLRLRGWTDAAPEDKPKPERKPSRTAKILPAPPAK
jgi:hypothetical protein